MNLTDLYKNRDKYGCVGYRGYVIRSNVTRDTSILHNGEVVKTVVDMKTAKELIDDWIVGKTLYPCKDPNHFPPGYISVQHDETYEHICPTCFNVYFIMPPRHTL